MSFDRFDEVEEFLRYGTFNNEEKIHKATVRRSSKKFRWAGDALWYIGGKHQRKVLRNEDEVKAVLMNQHNYCNHAGRRKCLKAVTDLYYWRSITRDVNDWIDNCERCSHPANPAMRLQCIVPGCESSGMADNEEEVTFHRFPFGEPDRLKCWISFTHRDRWSIHNRSAMCSKHFTEDSFEQDGDVVCLKPDAVPTIEPSPYQQGNEEDSSYSFNERSGTFEDDSTTQHAFFSKYDAIEKYLNGKGYPPGLTSVEKKAFRRLCTRFAIHDGFLFYTSGRLVQEHGRRRVVRSKEEVQATLTVYHDDMNHLSYEKCLKLISRHFFWGSLKADVAMWINRCHQCSYPDKPYLMDQCPVPETPEVSELLEPMEEQYSLGLPAQVNGTVAAENEDVPLSVSEVAVEDISSSARTKSLLHFQPESKTPDTPVIIEEEPAVSSSCSRQTPEESAQKQKSSSLSARTVIQQCSHALLQVKPQIADADSEWVEIHEGMVTYGCFYKGATKNIVSKMVLPIDVDEQIDYLEQFGSSTESALRKQSLYLKFDPLVKESPKKTASADNTNSGFCLPRPSLAIRMMEAAKSEVKQKSQQESPKLLEDFPPLVVEAPVVQDPTELDLLVPTLKQPQKSEGVIVDVLKYSQKDMDAAIERARKQAEEKEEELKAQIAKMTMDNEHMVLIMSEFESIIAQITAEHKQKEELVQAELSKVFQEKQQLAKDLNDMERSFSDVVKRLDRRKEVIDGFKKNEETLKQCAQSYLARLQKEEQRYQMLKTHAEEKIEQANKEIADVRSKLGTEISAFQVQLRREQLKVQSLEKNLEQKVKEVEDVTKLCDELIMKVQKH